MRPQRLSAWLAGLAVLAAGLVLMAMRLAYDLFDADELQHAHLAWLVAGGKQLYVDIWDNHGPLYTLANAVVLRLADPAPSLDLLFACRALSACAAIGIGACTWLIARRAGLSRLAALTAVSILASLVFAQDKAMECRPDGWQNLFWLAGLALLATGTTLRRAAGAGALWASAILINAKAALGPLAVLLFWLLGRRWHGRTVIETRRAIVAAAAGGLAVYLPVLAWFQATGAAWALHEYALLWNLQALGNSGPSTLSDDNVRFLVVRQWPFVLALLLGSVWWIVDLARRHESLQREAAAMIATAALITGLSLGMDFYYQFFLICLPLWSIVAAHGVQRSAVALAERFGPVASWTAGVAAAAGAAVLLATAARITPESPRHELVFQESFTRFMLATTPREEPLGVIWDICGGFMFNEPLQFYWGAEAAIGKAAERHAGSDPFGQPFIDALERGQVRFVIGRDTGLLNQLPAITQSYLRERYRYSNCLWTRRTTP